MKAAVWTAVILILGYVALFPLAVIAGAVVGVTRAIRARRRDRAFARHRARQLAEDARNEIHADIAVAMTCDPCHGRPGTCTCKSKAACSHPLCGADDTTVSDLEFSRELRALLDGEGGGRG